MDQIKSAAAVVVVPLPMQSHLNQLLHLSAAISAAGIPVHYVGSAIHNRQAKLRAAASGLKPESIAGIRFHDFPIPPLILPQFIIESTKNPDSSRFPAHLIPAFTAYQNFGRPVADLVRELSATATRVAVVFDRFVEKAVEEAIGIPNVECYAFHGFSAFGLFYLIWTVLGKPAVAGVEDDDLIFRVSYSVKELFPYLSMETLLSLLPTMRERAGDIHNTTRLIEGKYVNLLEGEEFSKGKKQFAIRLNPSPKINSKITCHECLNWLDNQGPKSVLYVSFGTSITLSNEEAWELAVALEESHQKFIWVVRGADGTDIFSGGPDNTVGLPEGFEERVGERGMVVRDWAPQAEILAHESTAAFMSHCGWNSCLESLTAGVPVLAWPMHTDQPLNAALLTEYLKVGVLVREWRVKGEVVAAGTIKNAIERLMATEEGGAIRKRAEELSAAVKEGDKEIDNFIAHITR